MTRPRLAIQLPGLVLLAVIALTACSQPEPTPSGTESVIRDSAGTSVVTHSHSVLERDWRTLGDPVVQIGAADGDAPYLLSRVFFGHVLDDGRIAIADGGSAELRFFDANGRHLLTTGGRGEGPGELELVAGMIASDTLIGVVEATRTSWFHHNGTFVRSDGIDLGALARHGIQLGNQKLLASGQWSAVTEDRWSGEAFERREALSHAILIPRDASSVDTLASFPSGLQVRVGEDHYAFAPFWPQMVSAAGGPESHSYVASNRGFEIRQYDDSGSLVRLHRFEAEGRPLTDDAIEQWKASRRARSAGTASEARVERELASVPFPDVIPPYRRFQVDRLGRLWAERWTLPGEPRRLLVIEPNGAVLGNVAIPDRFVVIDAGEKHLLGVLRDEFDVEYVQLFGS